MRKYIELFSVFCKISLFTLGGGLAMVPLIEREVTERKKWLEKKEFLDIFTISNSMPGVISLNIAAATGYKIAGLRGAIIAALGTVVPPFVSIVLIAWFLLGIKDNRIIARIFAGIRPAIMALITIPIITLSRAAQIPKALLSIPACVAVAIGVLRIQPALIVMFGLVSALAWVFIKRRHV